MQMDVSSATQNFASILQETKNAWLKSAHIHIIKNTDLEIEIIENQVSTLKYKVEELKKINKEKLENVRVEAKSNSKQWAQPIHTIDDVVQRLKILEQEHTEHTEEEAVVNEARAETESKTYKDQNESTDSGINKSGEADEKMHMKGDTIESSVKKIKANEQTVKIISTDNKRPNYKCQHCDLNCPSKDILNKHTNTRHAVNVPYKECEATLLTLRRQIQIISTVQKSY